MSLHMIALLIGLMVSAGLGACIFATGRELDRVRGELEVSRTRIAVLERKLANLRGRADMRSRAGASS